VREVVVVRPDGERARLGDLGVWELLNVAPDAALDAYDMLQRTLGDPQAAGDAVARKGISGLGYQAFGLRLAERFGNALPPGVVLVPSTAHYSFAKACRVLGMGESHLLRVPVDTHFRQDTDALDEILDALAAQHRPVIACVSVMDTTEEALALHDALASAELSPFRLVLLPRPDVNIVCFAIGHPELDTLEESNELAERVYRAMSLGRGRPLRALDYVVTKTVLQPREYGHAADPVLEGLGCTHDDYLRAAGIAVVRCAGMDSLLAARRGNTDHIEQFIETLGRVMRDELAAMERPTVAP
jgi:hypothetical protein